MDKKANSCRKERKESKRCECVKQVDACGKNKKKSKGQSFSISTLA